MTRHTNCPGHTSHMHGTARWLGVQSSVDILQARGGVLGAIQGSLCKSNRCNLYCLCRVYYCAGCVLCRVCLVHCVGCSGTPTHMHVHTYTHTQTLFTPFSIALHCLTTSGTLCKLTYTSSSALMTNSAWYRNSAVRRKRNVLRVRLE